LTFAHRDIPRAHARSTRIMNDRATYCRRIVRHPGPGIGSSPPNRSLL
jgi:hypothetical protein